MRGLRPNQPHRFGENVGVSCCMREGVNDGMYVVQIPCTVAQRYAFYSDYLAGECLRKGGRSVQSADCEGLSQGGEEVCECLQRVLLQVDLQAHLTLEIGAREAQGLEDTEGLGLLADEHLE